MIKKKFDTPWETLAYLEGRVDALHDMLAKEGAGLKKIQKKLDKLKESN